MTRGRFITFEGGEGAGKSTQVKRLLAALTGLGISTVATREPGGSEGAEAIRALLVTGEAARWDPWTEALLHSAARRDHLLKTVWPALERGDWVVCDRFADSTLAYQGWGHGLPVVDLEALTLRTVGASFAPDLTLVLDLPVAEGLARAGQRAGCENRYESMGQDFHEKLRVGFTEIAIRSPGRCVLLDGTLSVEEVEALVWGAVQTRLMGDAR